MTPAPGTFRYGKNIKIKDKLKITRPDGSIVHVIIKHVGVEQPNGTYMLTDGSESADDAGAPQGDNIGKYTDTFTIEGNSHNYAYTLNWSNCFSFGNGVESNRVRDSFNNPFLTPGVRVSTIFEDYKEEKRTSGLIYSGLYNNNSGVNNLNQFIQAEKITKDLNPTYGSIQKLHARDSDLIALCEDKVIRILANKDALYNADGNPQLVANINVLGQSIPFAGEFGISKNPESFTSEAYRSYFTDKQRGTVMRLSKDGLTPISQAGMKDYFRDNLKDAVSVSSGYDVKKDELNVTTTYVSPIKVNILETKINGNNGANLGWSNEGGGEFGYDRTRTAVQYEKVIIPFKRNVTNWSSQGEGVGVVDGADYKIKFTLAVYNGHLSGDLTLKLFNSVQASSANGVNAEIRHFTLHAGGTNMGWDGNVVGGTVVSHETSSNPYNWEYDYEVIFNEENYPARFNHTTSFEDYPNSLVFQSKENNDGVLFQGLVKDVIIERIDKPAKTITYKENVKGWTSFKSFLPEESLSCSGDYYSFKNGLIYRHHEEDVDRNTFYEEFTPSTLEVLLNDQPGSVKSFHTIDYEGSQSKIDLNENANVDLSYYNLEETDGWYVHDLYTDLNKGHINEFIKKEGKYFNYIKGVNEDINEETDFGSTTIQGIGTLDSTPITLDEIEDSLGTTTTENRVQLHLMFKGPANVSLQDGDYIYYVKSNNVNNNISPENIIKYPSQVLEVNQYPVNGVSMHRVKITQDVSANGAIVLEENDYFMFSKDSAINNSSLVGYYASVNLTNNSKEKVELFTIASDVSESSK